MDKIQIVVFFITISCSIESGFTIKNLDHTSKNEVAQVCQLFNHDDITSNTSFDSCDMRYLIDGDKKGIFVANFLENQALIVAGVLVASYASNALRCYGKTVAWNQVPEHYIDINDAIYFDLIAIHPEFRQLGIATSLMEYVQSQALDYRVPYLMLSVFKNNESAIACYRKQGFKHYKDGCDAVVLRKDLFEK